ncbi:MAG: hypothetical protein JWN33_180 [Candidatus Saccharibacteria bacterium]|nr:hypothetical protein [Candidatus Saccharibacteria bacterium]
MERAHPRDTAPNDYLLSKIEVYKEREGGLMEAMVPIGLIDRSEVPVDQSHVDELALSMAAEIEKGSVNGQLSPILLGHIPGERTFKIIDGFHRDAAQQQLNATDIFSTIKINTSAEEVLDLRIMTAHAHTNVSFARTYEWVSDAWQKTEWARRIDVAQVFRLASNKKMTGRNLGLKMEEAEAIRAWAIDKSERWRKAPSVIHNVMATAQISDPELIKQVRRRRSGHELTNLTPEHLNVIAKAFPNRHEEQKLISEVVIKQNLKIDDTRRVVEFLHDIKDARLVQVVIEKTNWQALLGYESQSPTKKTDKSLDKNVIAFPVPASGKLALQLLQSESRVARLTLENSALSGAYVAAPIHDDRHSSLIIEHEPKHALADILEPVSNEATVDGLLEWVERVSSRYHGSLLGAGLNDEQAAHAIRSAGQRVSRDIEAGALRYVPFTRPQAYDEVMKACLRDELQITLGRQNAAEPLAESRHAVTYDVQTALEVLPSLKQESRSVLALSGLFHLGKHSVAQALRMSQLNANDLLAVAKHRMSAAERASRAFA